MWEDYVTSVGNIVVALSLINTIRDEQKPPLSTSIPTMICVLGFAASSFSLGLYLSTGILAVVFVIWAVIAWQRFRQGDVQVREK